ncbi:EamA family transporter [Escherichia coli]|uniref:EamA family transporter n=1 Tax=Escherichia coli TaxID=562 RepID=UPI003D81BC7E
MFTAIAPAIWGSTYIVTTQYLPNFSPMTVAMLRALPAGLLLVMIVRQIPTGIWWMRIFILGALNISLFWSLLFISVYRLPGGKGEQRHGRLPLAGQHGSERHGNRPRQARCDADRI